MQVVLSLISLKVKCTCHNCIFCTAENSTTSVDWKQTLFLQRKHTVLKSWTWNKQNEIIFHTVFSYYLIEIITFEVAMYQWKQPFEYLHLQNFRILVWKKWFHLSCFRWLLWIFFRTAIWDEVLVMLVNDWFYNDLQVWNWIKLKLVKFLI